MKNQEFEKYVEKYDMSDEMIHLKYYHTYRVVEYAKRIAESEHLEEHDFFLVVTAALLHDIARFEQVTLYHTFNDKISFDHGDRGYEILLENDYIGKYVDNEEDKKIVLKAVKYHNKRYLDDSFTEKEKLIADIVRDADRLDIMDDLYNEIEDGSTRFNPLAFEEVKNHSLCTNINVDNGATFVLRTIAFLFDFQFKESYRQLYKNNIIQRKLELLRKHVDKDQVDELEKILTNYIDSQMLK